ncbi:MAG: type IV toxin-antitoxin system AbiEi family antitoxin domain-containing protein [Sciscionella sp.]
MEREDNANQIRSWSLLLAAQHGVVTRDQLSRQGVTDHTIAAHIAAGRWRRIHRGVVATFTGPLTRPAQPQ